MSSVLCIQHGKSLSNNGELHREAKKCSFFCKWLMSEMLIPAVGKRIAWSEQKKMLPVFNVSTTSVAN